MVKLRGWLQLGVGLRTKISTSLGWVTLPRSVGLTIGLQEASNLSCCIWTGLVWLQVLLTLDWNLPRAFHMMLVVRQRIHQTVGTHKLGLKLSRLSASPMIAHHSDSYPYLVQGGFSESYVQICHCFSHSASRACSIISTNFPIYSCAGDSGAGIWYVS